MNIVSHRNSRLDLTTSDLAPPKDIVVGVDEDWLQEQEKEEERVKESKD